MLLSALVTGLALGSMYGLLALGFHVTYAVSGTVNFSQGSSMTLGAVLGFFFIVLWGWPVALGAPAVLLLCAIYGIAVERFAVDFRAVDAAEVPPSSVHLPDNTRCAASATASAISEPSLVALAATLVAACCAVSAASRPASRIARRALGLALIAAAAAASPAASISLLIAAFAILSVMSLEREDFVEDLEELFLAALAIASSPSIKKDTLQP